MSGVFLSQAREEEEGRRGEDGQAQVGYMGGERMMGQAGRPCVSCTNRAQFFCRAGRRRRRRDIAERRRPTPPADAHRAAAVDSGSRAAYAKRKYLRPPDGNYRPFLPDLAIDSLSIGNTGREW